MSRPSKDPDVTVRVEEIWAADPKQSAKSVHKTYRERFGAEASLSWTEKVVSGLKKRRVELGNPCLEKKKWIPWVSNDTSEETSFIFELQQYSLVHLGRSIYEHEAAWAKRLRVPLSGAPMRMTWILVSLYSFREEWATSIGREKAATDDLDGFVAFKAWLPERKSEYIASVKSELVTFPHFVNWPESFRDRLPPETKELSVKLVLDNLDELWPEIFG